VHRPRVLVTHRPFPETVELLAANLQVDVNQTPDTLTAAELRTRAAEVDGLLVFMPDHIDSRPARRLPPATGYRRSLEGLRQHRHGRPQPNGGSPSVLSRTCSPTPPPNSPSLSCRRVRMSRRAWLVMSGHVRA